ncbi:ABC transporter permease [Candidatus Bipolaricaulota bacterium]
MINARKSIRRALRNPLMLVGLIGLFIFVVVAAFSDIIQPYPDDSRGATHIYEALLPPSWEHPFGTGVLGRDVFSTVVAGSRISLMTGTITVAGILSVGISLGLVAGFVGGWIEETIMRITDLFLSFPSLLLAMAITAALGPSLRNAMLAVAITWWPSYCRLTRGEVLSLKQKEFTESARAIGASPLRIMFRHILPNCFAPIFVAMMLDIGLVILTTSSLSFLGLGAQSPTPEWGLLITTGRAQFLTHWWVTTFPGLALFAVVMSFSLVGEGLREILDPRMRGRGR